MALGDFFRINMPYGMQKNENGEWFVYNREYKPLGWNTYEDVNPKGYPVFTKYKGLTEAKLIKLACPMEDTFRRDESSVINQIWFYSDGTNPKNNPKYWESYFEKIKLLSSLEAVKGNLKTLKSLH